MRSVYTGMRAEQDINGATKMVIKRSFQLAMLRVAITPGMAHATLLIKGTTDFPFNPNGRIKRSMMNTTRAMYPVSSSMVRNKKSKAICGTKTTTPPMPGIMPSDRRLVNTPSGKCDCA